MSWPNETLRRPTRAQREEFLRHMAAVARVRKWEHVKPYRANPRADVSATYSVYGGEGTFRSKNAEHLYDLDLLLSEGLIGEPMFFRGFVERVSARAHRFLEIADELFSLAPIRHLALIGVPAVVDELAA